MPSIFSKNCILTGLINHYCLICSKHFEVEEEILAHTLDPHHKQNLNSNGYFNKYQGDSIRKLKGLYFCELCNMTFPTATRVALHVAEESHITKKSKSIPVVRKNNDIVAFGRFIISEDAWNGFIDDTCFLCHAEFDDKAAHKTSKSHILKLIKSDVILGDGTIYRKIDDKLYQCITCNIAISETERSKHFVTTEHSNGLEYEIINIPEIDIKKLIENEKNIKADNENKYKNQDKTLKSQDKAQKTQDVIDKELKTYDKVDKTQEKTDKIQDEKDKYQDETNKNQDMAKNNKDAVNNARKDNAKPTKKPVDKRKSVVDLDEVYCKSLGAKDYVAGTIDGEWCILCERVLDVSADEHIRSKHHQTVLKMHKESLENHNSQNGASNGEKANLLEFVDKYQKCNVNIDLINETAFCKQCSQNIEFDSDAIDKHIEDHKKKVNKKSKAKLPLLSGIKSDGRDKTTLFTKPLSMADNKKGSSSAETWSVAKLEEFAKQHGLKHNRADNSFYCHACCRRLPTTREDLEKHVGSEGHKNNTSKQSIKQIKGKPVRKETLSTYVETFKIFETVEDTTDIVINGKYCLNAYDFCLLEKIGHIIFCHACEIDLAPKYIMSHITSESHVHTVAKCLIVTSLENEFVREIKLNTYHCGFCNIVENDWEDMLDHLTTEEHKTCKIRAQVALEKYAADRARSFNATYFELMFENLMKKFGFKQQSLSVIR